MLTITISCILCYRLVEMEPTMGEVLDMMEVNWTDLMKYLNRENQLLAENSRQVLFLVAE